jgi:dienelactone hydrolase
VTFTGFATCFSLLGAVVSSVRADSGTPGPYEEDLLASSPIRVEQWRQMEAYAASLPGTGPDRGASVPVAADAPAEVLRDSFRRRLGYPAPGFLKDTPIRLERIGEDAAGTYFRCHVKVTPQMETYGLYIVPSKARFPAPLVIAMHGGGGFPELATFHGGSNYHDLVRGSVAQGYVTFAPLAVMYPYRDRDHGTPIPADVRERLDGRLKSAGTTLMGVEVTKVLRALDVLAARPEVDPGRIGMIGLSYGGFYTLYTAALDPRIRVGVASCSFWDRLPGHPTLDGKLEETRVLTSAELVKLVSPRPLQVQNGIQDALFPIEDVRRAVARSRPFYPGPLAASFEFDAFIGAHEFRGELAWPFLKKHL